MICENCGKKYQAQKSPQVVKDGNPKPVTFCCYECYLEFWGDVPNFEPLPEYEKSA